jgi:hypothetical protein
MAKYPHRMQTTKSAAVHPGDRCRPFLFADDDCCICMEPMQQPVALPCNPSSAGCMSGIVNTFVRSVASRSYWKCGNWVIRSSQRPLLSSHQSTWTFTSTVNAVSGIRPMNNVSTLEDWSFLRHRLRTSLSWLIFELHTGFRLVVPEATAQVKEEAIHLQNGSDQTCLSDRYCSLMLASLHIVPTISSSPVRYAISPDLMCFVQAVGRSGIGQASTAIETQHAFSKVQNNPRHLATGRCLVYQDICKLVVWHSASSTWDSSTHTFHFTTCLLVFNSKVGLDTISYLITLAHNAHYCSYLLFFSDGWNRQVENWIKVFWRGSVVAFHSKAIVVGSDGPDLSLLA